MSSLSLRRSSLLNRKGFGLLRVLMTWIETRRTRIALSHLDDRLLEDVGITPAQARSEAEIRLWH